MAESQAQWDEDVEVLVFGSGAGGLSSALFAAKKGLSVVVCEKTDRIGGTTATSGGIAWVPCSEQAKRAGIEDSADNVRTYLRHELGNYYRSDLIDAYLAAGPTAIATLEKDTEVKFDFIPWPDYHANQPGGMSAGRSIETRRFDGRRLGPDFERLRPPIKRLMLLGGLSIDKRKVDDFLNPFRSFGGFFRVVRTFARYGTDLLSYSRGTDIGAGNALIARLFLSLRDRKVEVWTDAPLKQLVMENGEVQGAIVERDGRAVRVRARKAVILATGGFPHDAALRAELAPAFPHNHVVGFEGNTGDGLRAARAVGAAVDTETSNPALWTPVSTLKEQDGTESAILYGYLDRGRPGMIAVDSSGKRFTNESNSYHDIVTAMFKCGAAEGNVFHFVCDRSFVWKRGLGMIRPFRPSLKSYAKSGYIIMAETLPELARKIGVDADTLVKTVSTHNSYAESGIDPEFGRGSDPYNRMFGDPAFKPNCNLGPIKKAPFIALRIHVGSLGTAIGLKTDADAQVMSTDGKPIPKLYACGNELASIMRGFYPGGGITIGPAIVFGYRAVEHASERAAS